jgi:peptidoglycan-N-acetylglucosamine deacetylase
MIHRIPVWFQNLFPKYTWQIESEEKSIYLTFDDGPVPEITEWVLKTLNDYKIEASFFVVGENVSRHPKIFKQIVDQGHAVGNHTFNHVKGWSTSAMSYIKNAEKCSLTIVENGGEFPKLFRPPHGRIKPSQAKQLREQYDIVMWNVLSVDYDKSLDKEKCLRNTIGATRSGSIMVFHDSLKAEKNLRYALPKYIEHFLNLGYSFKKL